MSGQHTQFHVCGIDSMQYFELNRYNLMSNQQNNNNNARKKCVEIIDELKNG